MTNDDTPRLDRARLERLLGKESADLHAAWEWQHDEPMSASRHNEIYEHLGALSAERDALLAYARMMTAFALEVGEDTGPGLNEAIAKMQDVAGVAHLLDQNEG